MYTNHQIRLTPESVVLPGEDLAWVPATSRREIPRRSSAGLAVVTLWFDGPSAGERGVEPS